MQLAQARRGCRCCSSSMVGAVVAESIPAAADLATGRTTELGEFAGVGATSKVALMGACSRSVAARTTHAATAAATGTAIIARVAATGAARVRVVENVGGRDAGGR